MADPMSWLPRLERLVGDIAIVEAVEAALRDGPKSMRVGLFVVGDGGVIFYRKRLLGDELLAHGAADIVDVNVGPHELSRILGDEAQEITFGFADGTKWNVGPLHTDEVRRLISALPPQA